FSDYVTTVSPSYANEIQTPEFGVGLEGALQYNNQKIRGIINGIDYQLNDPATDNRIPYHYSMDDMDGKLENKRALQEKLGLPVKDDVALMSSISRLTDQKGFQLIQEKMEELMHTRDVQLVILGTGDPQFEQAFT